MFLLLGEQHLQVHSTISNDELQLGTSIVMLLLLLKMKDLAFVPNRTRDSQCVYNGLPYILNTHNYLGLLYKSCLEHPQNSACTDQIRSTPNIYWHE